MGCRTLLVAAEVTFVFAATANAGNAPFRIETTLWLEAVPPNVLQLTQIAVIPDHDIVVSNIVLNRGNCPMAQSKIVNGRFAEPSFPIQFKFGVKQLFWTGTACDVRELVFTMQDGTTWTWFK